MSEPGVASVFLEESCYLLDQSLVKIHHCLRQMSDEQIWWRPQESLNSVGNLILHMGGNLRQWSVVGIGGLPDDRDRPSEFLASRRLPRQELVAGLDGAVAQAQQLFRPLSADQLLQQRRIQEFDVTVLRAICHTVSHFVGHSHQIIYLTRLALGDRYEFHWSPAAERSNLPI